MIWHSRDSVRKDMASLLRPPLAVALQGGGAYGAFEWGVLDRLLEEDGLVPAAMSGSSAGAINAVVAAWGLREGGRAAAQTKLAELWKTVGQYAMMSPMAIPGVPLQLDLLTRLLSPYQFNPLNINPLRDLVADLVDFDRLKDEGTMPLFIGTTNVATGQPRIFREHEITLDVLMASSCIPYLHHSVEIDGQSYWDGGFTTNPPIMPLMMETECRSLLLVKLTPDTEPLRLHMAPDVLARLKRILFNAPLLRDLDAVAEMQGLLQRTALLPSDLRRVRDFHIIEATIDDHFFEDGKNSALDPRQDFLDRLHAAGWERADYLLSRSLFAEALTKA